MMMMPKNQIVKLFPKCLYLRNNVCREDLDVFEDTLKELNVKLNRSPILNVDSSHQSIDNLHRIKPFDKLEKEILFSVKEYMTDYGYIPERISGAYIQNMWFNISNQGDFLFPHVHYGSFLSGAYYIKCNKENVILFHDEDKHFYEDVVIPTQYNQTIEAIPCIESRLLLFPSNFRHSTPIQKSEGEKIVISFNILLENKNEH